MSGNVEHVELDLDAGDVDPIALDEARAQALDVLAGGAPHGAIPMGRQCQQPADMVAVMVRGENGIEREAVLGEEALDGRRIARVDDRGVRAVGEHPEVVVLESGNRMDLQHMPSLAESIRMDSWPTTRCRAGSRLRSGVTCSTRSAPTSTT
jgi:hypothetical protein